MKIAILYIATGKYIIFWKEFYVSCEKRLLPGIQKEYFVFTDTPEYDFSQNDNVHTIQHQKLGWPYDTLMRFQTFLKAKEQLLQCDYIYFFNANMLITETITPDEFLPDAIHDEGLVATLHPGFFDKPRNKFTYEDAQKDSTAYITAAQGKYYFMGGLNGGTTKAYLQLIETLNKNINIDLSKGIIARWHDESHLNKYLINKTPKILSPAYGYPEGRRLPFTPKIIIRDKNKYGGHDFLRGEKNNKSIFESLKSVIKKLLKK